MTVAQHKRLMLALAICCEQKGAFKTCMECGYQDGHDMICQYHESKRADHSADDPNMVKVPRELLDRFPEINMANFGADEVNLLNDWGIEVSLLGECTQCDAAPSQPQSKAKTEVQAEPVAWVWEMHGWIVTAHGKHRGKLRSVDVCRPPESTVNSDDFIRLVPLYAAPAQRQSQAVIEQGKARIAELEYVLGRIDKAAKDSTTIIGFASKAFGMLGAIRAALSNQEQSA